MPDHIIHLQTYPPENSEKFFNTEFFPPNMADRLSINDRALNPLTVLILHDYFYDYFSWPYLETFRCVIQIHRNTLESGILQKLLDKAINIDLMIFSIVERDFYYESFFLAKLAEKL